jgi:hypothetical protein
MANASGSDMDGAKYRQGLVALFVLFIAFTVQIVFQPYEDERGGLFTLNFIETMSIIVGILSIYLGLWTFARDVSLTLQFGITFSIMILNFLFVLLAMAMVFQSIRDVFIAIRTKLFGAPVALDVDPDNRLSIAAKRSQGHKSVGSPKKSGAGLKNSTAVDVDIEMLNSVDWTKKEIRSPISSTNRDVENNMIINPAFR